MTVTHIPCFRTRLNADIDNIISVFDKLMTECEGKIIPIKSIHVHGLSLFEDMYVRSRCGSLSLLCKPVLVVSSVSVLFQKQGCFSTLLSRLKSHCMTHGYLLKIESVIAPELRAYLIRQMFVFPGEECQCGSGYWVHHDDPAYYLLTTLPS